MNSVTLKKIACAFLMLLPLATAYLPHLESVRSSIQLNSTVMNCTKLQFTYSERIQQKSRLVYKKKGVWPFRKNIVETEYYNVTVPSYNPRTVVACCENFHLDEKKQHCLPVCQPACPFHAECYHPNSCKCWHGYKEIREQDDLQCIPSNVNIVTDAIETVTDSSDYESSTWDASTEYNLEQDFDCRLSECPADAICLQNGTCVCLEGYIRQESMYCLQQHESLMGAAGTGINEVDLGRTIQGAELGENELLDVLTLELLAVILGVAMVIGFLSMLVRHFRRRQLHSNVEKGKNSDDKRICCKYVGDNAEPTASLVY